MTARVITFYSFKGGVGRTQALANVAVALAQRGHEVVLVDMDFESPGLHAFFGPEPGRRWSREDLADKDGLLEFLEEAAQLPDELPPLHERLLLCAHHQLGPNAAPVKLLLPGRMNDAYPERIAAFSWDDFYRDREGYALVEVLRRELVSGDADYVLIDSRTGLTDVAGICTSQLPDIVVALFALHEQGIDGVLRVAEAITRAPAFVDQTRGAQKLVLVAARVEESGDGELRDQWEREAKLRLGTVEGELWSDVHWRVPYDSGAAFGEQIVVGAEHSALSTFYERLTDRLGELAGHAGPASPGAQRPAGRMITQEAVRRIQREIARMDQSGQRIQRELGILRDELERRLPEVELENPFPWNPVTLDDYRAAAISLPKEVDGLWARWREAWLGRFRVELEHASEGDTMFVQSTLTKLEPLLERGDLEAAREFERIHKERARESAPSVLLERDRLDNAHLARVVPDHDAQIQWLEDRLAEALEEILPGDSEKGVCIIRNCLRLLVTMHASGASIWSAYEVLCEKSPDTMNEDFEAVGHHLWRAAWQAYLHADAPPPPDDALPAGRRMRQQLREHDASSRLGDVIDIVARGVATAWARWPQPVHSFEALFRLRSDDPALRGTVARLPDELSPDDRRAILSLWLASAGPDRDISGRFIRALLHEDFLAEAFFACEAMRRRGQATPPGWRQATFAFALKLAKMGGSDLLDELCLDKPRLEAMVEEEPGVLFLAVLAGHLASRPLVTPTTAELLRQFLLYERRGVGSEAIDEWLRWLEQHPQWDPTFADARASLGRDLEKTVEHFPTYKKWAPSQAYKEEFGKHWRRLRDRATSPSAAGNLAIPDFETWLHDARKTVEANYRRNIDPQGDFRRRWSESYEEARAIITRLLDLHDSPGGASDPGARQREARAAVRQSASRQSDPSFANDLVGLLDVGATRPNVTDEIGQKALLPPNASDQFKLSPLLVRFEGPDPWKQFFDDLLRTCAGLRTWVHAAAEYREAEQFVFAARSVQNISNTEDRHDEARQLELAWQAWRDALDGRVRSLRAHANKLASQGADTDYTDDARGKADQISKLLSELGQGRMQTELVDALAQAPVDDVQRLVAELYDAEENLELAELDLEDRRQQIIDELKLTKSRIDSLINDLILDNRSGELALKAMRAAIKALQQEDLDGLKRLLGELEKLRDGVVADIDIPDVAAPPASVTTSPPVAIQRERTRPRLSELASRLLDQESFLPASTGPATTQALPAHEWREDTLSDIAARGHRGLHPLAHDERLDSDALGPWLTAQARLYLVQENSVNARTLFGDLLDWVSWKQPGSFQTRMREWHRPATWGFSLSFLPYLPREEQIHIREPDNLAALLQHPFGERPLAILEQHDLLREFGRQMLALSPEGADELHRYFIAPFIDEHPIAAKELAAGWFRRASPRTETLARLVTALLEPVLPDADARVMDALRTVDRTARADRSVKQDDPVTRARAFRVELRSRLAEHASRSGIVQSLIDALDGLEHELSTPRSPDQSVVASLVTKRVAATPNTSARLVLAITGQPDSDPIYELRADVALLDETGVELRDAIMRPSPIDCVRPRERREMAVTINNTRLDDVYRATRVRVRYRTPDNRGQWKPLGAHHQSYAIQIEKTSARMMAPPSPYVVGRAVQNLDRIYGRRETVEQILAKLEGQDLDNVVLVLGDRRIGKTTLLNAVIDDKRRKERYPLLVLENQEDLPDEPRSFFDRLIRSIEVVLEKHDVPCTATGIGGAESDPGYAFRQFMKSTDSKLASRDLRMLVVLDELEKVYDVIYGKTGSVRKSHLSQTVLASIRGSIQECRRISFVLAGVTDQLRPYIDQPDDRLFQLALIVELDALDTRAARELITQPVAEYYEVSAPAADHLAVQTGGQPYLLQRIAAELFQHMMQSGGRTACVIDVDEVMEQRVLSDSSFFRYLVDPWQRQGRFSLLKAIARLQSGLGYIAVPDIRRQLARMGADREEDAIAATLKDLSAQVKTVVDRDPFHQDRFRLKVPLLARHLRWTDQGRVRLVLK